MATLSNLEKKILLQLKFNGFYGKSGNLTKKQRYNYLSSLVNRGYLDKNCHLTTKSHNELNNL